MVFTATYRRRVAKAADDPIPTRIFAFMVAVFVVIAAAAIADVTAGPGFRWLSVMLAIFIASLVSSIAGFAFSAICGAMLFHLIEAPVEVVAIMLFCSTANQLMMTWMVRDNIKTDALIPFLVGGAIGLPFGIYLLLATDRAAYAATFGVLLILYGLYKMLRPTFGVARQSSALDMVAGVMGGVTGGAAAFPGAVVTIWCGCKGWDKREQRAVYQPFILMMQVATITALFSLHLVAPQLGKAIPSFNPVYVAYIAVGLVGSWYGMRCFARLNDRQFSLIVNAMLTISGLSFVL